MPHIYRPFNICLLLCLTLLIVSRSTAQEIQESETKDYNEGVQLFTRGLYSGAAKSLQKFVADNPEHQLRVTADYYRVKALGKVDSTNITSYFEEYIIEYPGEEHSRELFFELAYLFEEQNKYGRAIEVYERALNYGLDYEAAARANYRIAEDFVSMDKNVQARQRFLHLADTYPESEWAPKALYGRGRLYLSESMYDSSSTAFEILRNRYPNSEMTRRIGTALGESYYQQGKYEEAINAFQNAMPYLEGDLKSKAVYLIAESHNYLNRFDGASTYYKQYINLERGTDKVRKAHYGLGWIYHKQEIYHWAAEAFEKAAEGEGELARKALYYKAVNEKLGGRYPRAIETFRRFGDRYQQGLWVEQAFYEWAITAFEMGNYGESIEVLLPLVRSDRELDWAGKVYTLLGESYFANKEYTRAIQAFEAAEDVADIDSSLVRQARFQKAWVQYRNQAYEQAQPIFEQVHKSKPGSDLGKEALFWSADAYYQMKKFGPAAVRLEKFLDNHPDHKLAGAAYYSLGWSYFKMANYEQAIDPFKTFLEDYEAPPIELYPYDTDTRLRLGDSYYAVGAYQNAIATYEESIGAEPGGDYAMFQIGNSYYRDNKTYEAVTTFRRFLRIYPYSRLREQAQYNIAYIYLNSGNYTQAIEEFQTVINKYPNTSWAARSQYNIGDAFYNAGEYDKAVNAYRKVMEAYPRSDYIIEAVDGIQYAQLSAGKSDSSTAVLEEFLAEHPQATTADRLRYRQAENLMESGDYEGAISEFRQYIRVTNNRQLLPEAHYSLAAAYEQTDRMDKAIEQYELIVNNFSESDRASSSLAALGRISSEAGVYKQSYEYFSELLDRDDQFRLEALIGMGSAQLALGNIDRAKEQFEAALEAGGNYDPARVGLAKTALREQNFERAEDLLSLVAESNTTEIGAEAQYLLGVSSQRRKMYEEALNAYSNVKILYEAFEDWVSKAMLKSAECYIQLGDTGAARNELNSLIENYPGTEQAKKARELLQSN